MINNWLLYYVRDNGMTSYRSEELAQAGRMLTIFALYVSMTGDAEFMLGHWAKAKALGDWLAYRWQASITDYTPDDPRYGPFNYRTAARTLFLRPYLAHFCSFFRGFLRLDARIPESGTKRPGVVP